MKNLLSMLAVSTLVGTSASNLKPWFTTLLVNTGFKSNQLNKNLTMINSPFINDFQDLKNKKIQKVIIGPNGTIYAGSSTTGLWKSTDGINFKQVNGIPNSYAIQSIDIALSGEIWVGTNQDLYFSNDNGINFNSVTNNKINNITSIAIAPNGTIYATINTKLNKSIDGGITFEQINGISDEYYVDSIAIAPNGTVWVGTEKEGQHGSGLLYKSTDGLNFKSLSGIVETIKYVYLSDGNIYFTTGDYYSDGDLFKGHLIDNLFKTNKPDYCGNLYDGFVYKNEQKIDIKDKFIASAKFDNTTITIPTKDLAIPVGEHILFLTLKDEYKQYLDLFDENVTTGTVTYKLWVKTSINKNDIKYSTNKDDTELYTGLVSNAGNTKGADIIQTKNKNISVHQTTLNSKFNDILIDYPNSYYVKGNVDSSNNFIQNGTHQKVSKNLSMQTDGIYHLHLEDMVGNKYDIYLELGESNWKLKGTFDDSELDKLKSKLNVTVNLTDSSQKSKAMGWLHQYEDFVENKFNETIKINGKGFDSEIKKQITSYTAFLKPLTYDIANEPIFDDGLVKTALVKTINDKANEILNKGLDALPKNLNVNTSNVVNKSTLEHYTKWINNYQEFTNKNKDKRINDIEKIASHGFATGEQENQIKENNSNDSIEYQKSLLRKNSQFLRYIEFIKNSGILSNKYRKLLNEIRKLANNENHEIEIINDKDFLLLKDIMEQLIKGLE